MPKEIDRVAERRYLSRCMDAFMLHLDRGTFDDKMGKFTVFGGEPPKDPLEYYENYGAAIEAGYKQYSLDPFMVQEITMGHKIFGRWGAPRIATGLLAKALDNGLLGSIIPPGEIP